MSLLSFVFTDVGSFRVGTRIEPSVESRDERQARVQKDVSMGGNVRCREALRARSGNGLPARCI